MKEKLIEKILKVNKNLIVDGDISSGKTSNVLFPVVENIIEHKESLFILDSKEEYINKYYQKLKENNYNTIIINLRDMDKSENWNPLEYPYNLYKSGNIDKAQEYLEKIIKIMFPINPGQDPFWSLTSSDFLTGIALALFEDGESEQINFNSINNMFNTVDKKVNNSDLLTTYFKSKPTNSKPYIYASSTILAPRDTKGSILSIVRQKIRLYVSREKLSYLMAKTSFNIDNIIEKPTAIIFITRDENKYLNSLAAMFIEQLYGILIDKKQKNKFNFILDNFDDIDRVNDLNDILGSCLSRNIKVYLSTRSLKDLSIIYGNYMIRLCDVVFIKNNDVELTINNEKETIEKDFEKVVICDSNIEYPILNKEPYKVFYPMIELSEDLKDNDKINELIQKIDSKIEELESKERTEKKQAKGENEVK